MSKPVSEVSFWRERLDRAKKENRLHYSVYLARQDLWNYIFDEHKKIFDKVIPKGAKVLDAGCGYGRMASLFENYTGVDISPDLLEVARKDNPGKVFVEGNLKALPFDDKTFDWAFCVSIKKMIEDNLGIEEWKQMEKELKRVAKNVLICEYEDPKPYEIL